MSRIPYIRCAAAALAGLACACLGLAITACAASAQVLGPPGYGSLPTGLIRAALLHGEDLAPASVSGSVPSPGPATATAALATGSRHRTRVGSTTRCRHRRPPRSSPSPPAACPAGRSRSSRLVRRARRGVVAVLADRVWAARRRKLVIQRLTTASGVLPGGVLELSETPQDGPAGDLLEETGMHLRAKRLTRPRNSSGIPVITDRSGSADRRCHRRCAREAFQRDNPVAVQTHRSTGDLPGPATWPGISARTHSAPTA